jgi:hypothetical protein
VPALHSSFLSAGYALLYQPKLECGVSGGEIGESMMMVGDDSRVPWAVMDRVTAAFFFGLGRLRAARGFHPRGASFSASITALPGADAPWARLLVASRDGQRALVRFSKGAGLPDPLPDVLGLAVKISGESA